MIKRIGFLLLLALAGWEMLSSASAQTVTFTGSDGNTLYYNISYGEARVVAPNYPSYSVIGAWSGVTKPTGDVVIPDSIVSEGVSYPVTSVYYRAFATCSDLTSVTMGRNVEEVNPNAFYGCSSLMNFYTLSELYIKAVDGFLISNSYYAGNGPNSLMCCPAGRTGTATVPGVVVGTDNEAFEYCDWLEHIVFGANFVDLSYGLYLSDNVRSVTFATYTPPTTYYSSPVSGSDTLRILVPCGAVGAYRTATYWNSLSGQIFSSTADCCVWPGGLDVQPVGMTSVVANWTAEPGHSYTVAWSDDASLAPSAYTHSLSTSTVPVTLGGLLVDHVYYVSVRDNCDNSWSPKDTVRTYPQQLERIYVKPVACGSADGSSWANAMSDIEDAALVAQTIASVYHTVAPIWVAEGTYRSGLDEDNYHFTLPRGVELYGGFAGNEPAGFDLGLRDLEQHRSILDGEYSGGVLNITNYSGSTRVDGFWLLHGRNSYLALCASLEGAQVYNCVFDSCQAASSYSSSPMVTADNAVIDHCIIRNAPTGGILMDYTTMSNTLVDHCGRYGVEYNYSGRNKIVHCDIVNTWLNNDSQVALKTRNANDSVMNTVIWKGEIAGSGTFVHCAATSQLSGVGNLLIAQANSGSEPGVNYAAFVAPDNGMYMLSAGSALIDQASSAYASLAGTTDLLGNARLYGSASDIGCYEWNNTTYCLAPTQLAVQSAATSAFVTWVNPANEMPESFELQYRLLGGSWVTLSGIHSTAVMLTGLTPESSYQVQVRSLCGGGSSSSFSPVTNFSTPCLQNLSQEVQVGNGTEEMYYLPSYSYNSYMQSLYTPSELGMTNGGTINSLSLEYLYGMRESRDVQIYLGHTSRDYFDYWGDTPVDSADLTLVYSGAMALNGPNDTSWVTLTLQTPFVYDGVRNLVLAVLDNSDEYPDNAFLGHETEENMSMYGHAYYPQPMGDYYLYATNERLNLRLGSQYCGNVSNFCPQPNLGVADVTTTSARVMWDGAYELQYKLQESEDWGSSILVGSLEEYALSGLSMGATYQVRARNNCNGMLGAWTECSFTTQIVRLDRIYVTAASTPSGDGSSWENALHNLESAFVLAEGIEDYFHNHPQVWVAQGTYTNNCSRDYAFTLPRGVTVYGGLVGNEPEDYDMRLRDWRGHRSIMDGMGAQRVLSQPEAFTRQEMTIIDGMVIQNGYGVNASGVGVSMKSYAKLQNCLVQNNLLYVTTYSTMRGIGVNADINYMLSDSLILDNVEICNNNYITSESYINLYGGGLYLSTGRINRCHIHHNSAYSGGGLYTASYEAQVANSLINDNSASYYGGVSGYSDYLNCVVANNVSTNSYSNGAGIYNASTITNSIVWNNRVGQEQRNVYEAYRVRNSAVSDAVIDCDSVINCLVIDAANDGANGAANYVRFLDPTHGDFRLHVTSACIDRGDSTLAFGPLDLAGNNRVYGDNIDMGAYETQEQSNCPSPVNLHLVSVNYDSAVVEWSSVGSVASWTVMVNVEEEQISTSALVTSPHYCINDLVLNRDYQVTVRANCSEEEYSCNSIPLFFHTECDSSTLAPLSPFTSFLPLDNSLVYSDTLNFSWGAIPEATSYDLYVWAADSLMPAEPTLRHLTNTVVAMPLRNLFAYGRTYHWKVVAWNECLQLESAVHSVASPEMPNLHVTQVSCSTPVAGQSMTIEWTVRNDGAGSTWPNQYWYDNIWISNTSEIAAGWWSNALEVLLAQVGNLEQLGPGQQYTNTRTVTLPDTLVGGFYLFVMADQYSALAIDFTPTGSNSAPDPYTPSLDGVPYGFLSATNQYHLSSNVPETNELDNFFYKVVNILPPPSPDLQVTHISHPLNAFSDSDIEIQWTVTNRGSLAVLGDTRWWDKVYIYTDQMVEDTSLTTTMSTMVQVNVDSSYTLSTFIHIPLRLYGEVHVAVRTDVLNDINEGTNEYNNLLVSDQVIQVVMAPVPDLVVSLMELPETATAGEDIRLNFTVANVGLSNALSSRHWEDHIFMSDQPVLDTAHAVRLNYIPHTQLPNMDVLYDGTLLISVPASQRNDFYIHVVTDFRDVVFEHTGDTNNVASRLVHLVHPDLAAEMVEAPTSLNFGAENHISWMVRNVGQGLVKSQSVVSAVYADGIKIYTSNIRRTLEPGDSMLVSADIRIPCGTSDQVHYQVLVNDPRVNNAIYEGADTANNRTAMVTAQMAAMDLGVEILHTPDSAWSGKQVAVGYRVTNYNSTTIPCRFRVNFYCSNSAEAFDPANLIGSELIGSTTGFTGQLPSGEALVTMPNGIEGQHYIFAWVNAGDSVCEGANAHLNFAHSDAVAVRLSPSPDLVPALEMVAYDTLVAGQNLTVQYRVKNLGVAALEQERVQAKFYLSPTTGISNVAVAAYEQSAILSIAAGDSIVQMASFDVPAVLTSGNYHLVLYIDSRDEVYEHNGEQNNVCASNAFFVYRYPYDFRIDSVSGPREVHWGDRVNYTIHISDTSNYVPLQVMVSDGIYFSADSLLDARDASFMTTRYFQTSSAHYGYTAQVTVEVPYGVTGRQYLIAAQDVTNRHPDINRSNNQRVVPITELPIPTPDLAVSQVRVLDELVSGQTARVAYRVTNVDTLTISAKRWNDRAYVVLGVRQDSLLQVANSSHAPNVMAPGDSYEDTLAVCVPIPYCGALNLLVRANASNGFYEVNAANNDTTLQVYVELPMPGDLVVANINHPATLRSSDLVHVEWNVVNQGSHSMSGSNLKSLLYISADNQFDVNDKLLGMVTSNSVNLASQGSLLQQVDVRVSSLPEGMYYFLVKTDVQNAFYETNDDNNTSASADPFRLVLRHLPFDTAVVDTFINAAPTDFVLEVGNRRNETVRLSLLSSDSAQSPLNHIYVSHNTVGNNYNYSYATAPQGESNPELFIPATEAGYYGVSVFTESRHDSLQVGALEADILPFELRSILPNHGGNTGRVTVELKGSRFNPNMVVWMARGNDTIFASSLDFVNYFQSYAEFDLTGRTPGPYDVGILHHCEGEIVIADGFTVEEGLPDALNTHINCPTSPRPNRDVLMVLYFTNEGNTDIRNALIELRSEAGNPVSLTPAGLDEGQTVLSIPLSIEGEPEGLLRPGVTGQMLIYTRSNYDLVYSINRIR